MSNASGIFIFTKDRPEVFKSTLNFINKNEKHIYVIDDSVLSVNQLDNKKASNEHHLHYLGKSEFNQFISQHKIKLSDYSFLLREPGNIEWNLGYMRNFALVYATSLKLSKALFIDDDITVTDIQVIDRLFELTDRYMFAGAHISGMLDDSILGHVATAMEMPNERMLSGGCLAFNVNKVNHYFLNNYNEDWIWLYLQFATKSYIQTGEVFQAISEPLKSYRENGVFQEFGERALEGVMVSCHLNDLNLLISGEFWINTIRERIKYLQELRSIAIKLSKNEFVTIIEFIETQTKGYDAPTMCQVFENYFLKLESFKKLTDSLP